MAKNSSTKRRDLGSGCLIPPRLGITRFWTGQVYDANGRQVRRSLKYADGEKISGEFRGKDASDAAQLKDEKNWTNLSAARIALDNLRQNVNQGIVAVGSDPSQLHYADLRKLFLDSYREANNRSLLTNSETGEEYVCGLKHLDAFFGWEDEGDTGCKVSTITTARVKQFKEERLKDGASPATVNRSLAALRRMFVLAQEDEKLQPQHVPTIKLLAEPKQPRAGFLEPQDYDKLSASLPEYVRPLLQLGFYTGMRLGEIVNLKWGRVDLAANVIRLLPQDTKNKTGRAIPLIDGLPEMFEKLRRQHPRAGENDPVFLSYTDGKPEEGKPIGSFIKAWRNACVKAAIKTKLNGEEIVSRFEKDGTYRGFIFHDLRRSAVRNLVQAGVDRTTAKAITGHKTDEVFERYDIKVEDDLQDAAVKVAESLRQRREAATRKQNRKLGVVK